jgi:hypothetical protein
VPFIKVKVAVVKEVAVIGMENTTLTAELTATLVAVFRGDTELIAGAGMPPPPPPPVTTLTPTVKPPILGAPVPKALVMLTSLAPVAAFEAMATVAVI